MTTIDTLSSLVLAAIALYGLGVPLAWLLPAPAESAWVFRIAVGPLYAILLSSTAAWLLRMLGVPLHPAELLALILVAWAAAWWKSRHEWVREPRGEALVPALMVAGAGFVWFLSLVGYGLYLPNRDFKNHAYFVAQVAWTRSTDPALILRSAPSSVPEPGAYPLGLHSLLGWMLPTADWSSIGVTAASAVLATSISMPLSAVALARMWDPRARTLWILAGASGVVILGLTSDFRIGSVVLLVGSALFPAGLVALWLWLRGPSWGTLAALIVSGLGLFALHVAEAVGLALVGVACLPGLIGRRSGSRLRWRYPLAAFSGLIVAALLAQGMLRRLFAIPGSGFQWDIQPNTEDLGTAFVVALVQQPSGALWAASLWLALGLAGFVLARSRQMSAFPLIAFCVPVVLGTIAGARVAPAWLNLLTAPWYSTAARTGLMAAAPVILSASLSMTLIAERMRARRLAWASWLVALSMISILAVQVVPTRRADLAATLAGAGDSQAVARLLSERIQDGESVLNLEGDGTANLFAYSRVPVLTGLHEHPDLTRPGPEGETLTGSLLRLGEPEVQARMRQLGVAYIALGTTSRYWASEPGYAWQQLLSQPELSLELVGTDMVVLRYHASPT